MALKREYGQEQPYIPAGIFKIRLPFVHYRWEISECLQAVLMCATCLGAIPTLQSTMGVSYDVAWSMVIINGFFYCVHALLGDPVVPGWVTPAIPLTIAFLTRYEEGALRNQYLIALQMEVGIIFLIMGITGLANKVISKIPASIKAGILLGAGIAAIAGEFGEGGRFNLYPITVGVGMAVAYFLLFSRLYKQLAERYKFMRLLGNFGMLPAIIVAVIIGPLTGELPAPILQLGSFFKIPNFAGIIEEISPLGPTGWPSLAIYIACIPTALSIYIIAFGDFISSKSLIETAGTDSTTGDATLTLTSTSETASYNVLGTESMADALGNTVYDNLTGGQPTGYDTAKDIFSNATFNGNDTVLAVGSVFTKQ